MIPIKLHIMLIAAVLCYFILILIFLKNKALQLKYTLIWLAAGIFMGIMVAWPEALLSVQSIIGIEGSMNTLYILCLAFLVAIAMTLTSIVSKQSDKIKNVIQESARLEKRIRELEKYIQESKEQDE